MEFVVGCMDGYCPTHVIVEDNEELISVADKLQKAKGKLPLFDTSVEYDPDDWYNFYLELDICGDRVNALTYEYGLSGEYCGSIYLTDEQKEKAYQVVIDYYGGINKYKGIVYDYYNIRRR